MKNLKRQKSRADATAGAAAESCGAIFETVNFDLASAGSADAVRLPPIAIEGLCAGGQVLADAILRTLGQLEDKQ